MSSLPSPPDLKLSISPPSLLSSKSNTIIHDFDYCMFRIELDKKGNTAALCYLPTQYKNTIEFYHTEIPLAYRNQGLGDLLLFKAFQWVEKSKLFVIPTCPFVRKYLETRFPDHKRSCIILNNNTIYHQKETP